MYILSNSPDISAQGSYRLRRLGHSAHWFTMEFVRKDGTVGYWGMSLEDALAILGQDAPALTMTNPIEMKPGDMMLVCRDVSGRQEYLHITME